MGLRQGAKVGKKSLAAWIQTPLPTYWLCVWGQLFSCQKMKILLCKLYESVFVKWLGQHLEFTRYYWKPLNPQRPYPWPSMSYPSEVPPRAKHQHCEWQPGAAVDRSASLPGTQQLPQASGLPPVQSPTAPARSHTGPGPNSSSASPAL